MVLRFRRRFTIGPGVRLLLWLALLALALAAIAFWV
jgi:hypothetical protein